MQEYLINVTEIEELQMISNVDELKKIFARAKRTVVHGSKVILARKDNTGLVHPFDEVTTEEDLERYRKNVFKYLD